MKRNTPIRAAGSRQRTGERNVKVIYPKKESPLRQKAIGSGCPHVCLFVCLFCLKEVYHNVSRDEGLTLTREVKAD